MATSEIVVSVVIIIVDNPKLIECITVQIANVNDKYFESFSSIITQIISTNNLKFMN